MGSRRSGIGISIGRIAWANGAHFQCLLFARCQHTVVLLCLRQSSRLSETPMQRIGTSGLHYNKIWLSFLLMLSGFHQYRVGYRRLWLKTSSRLLKSKSVLRELLL